MDWSQGDRAGYYREQAGRFQELADMEAQPRARERLLQVAQQYVALAGHVARQKTLETTPGSRSTRVEERLTGSAVSGSTNDPSRIERSLDG